VRCRRRPHQVRPVHLIITMIQWIRTSRLSIKNSLSYNRWDALSGDGDCGPRRSLSLKLSDTRVYEPQIRARIGTGGTR